MSERNQREQWLQDLQKRQKNVVFQATLADECRLWRNIGMRTPTSLTWVGLAVIALFVFGFGAVILVMIGRLTWVVALVTLLVFGPTFGLIVWATLRNLRKRESPRPDR